MNALAGARRVQGHKSGVTAAQSPSQGLALANSSLAQGQGLLSSGEQCGPVSAWSWHAVGQAEAVEGARLQGLQDSAEMKCKGQSVEVD